MRFSRLLKDFNKKDNISSLTLEEIENILSEKNDFSGQEQCSKYADFKLHSR